MPPKKTVRLDMTINNQDSLLLEQLVNASQNTRTQVVRDAIKFNSTLPHRLR